MATSGSKAAAGSVGTVETQFLDLPTPLTLDCGRTLHPVQIAYETYGSQVPAKENVILVCHALSGDAYAAGWSDSAVRRYARDAGHLLGRLNQLVRCDCTTRSHVKVANLHRDIDDLESRIARLAEEDRVAAERPGIDGVDVMAHLGIAPCRAVGEALGFLLDIKRVEGDRPRDELLARLDTWWTAREG